MIHQRKERDTIQAARASARQQQELISPSLNNGASLGGVMQRYETGSNRGELAEPGVP